MKKILNFILKSSADPKKTSATIKFALVGIIPFLMQAWGIVCSFGHQCYQINPTLLESFFTLISEGTFAVLSLISIVGATWGLFRKVDRTLSGRNEALKL